MLCLIEISAFLKGLRGKKQKEKQKKFVGGLLNSDQSVQTPFQALPFPANSFLAWTGLVYLSIFVAFVCFNGNFEDQRPVFPSDVQAVSPKPLNDLRIKRSLLIRRRVKCDSIQALVMLESYLVVVVHVSRCSLDQMREIIATVHFPLHWIDNQAMNELRILLDFSIFDTDFHDFIREIDIGPQVSIDKLELIESVDQIIPFSDSDLIRQVELRVVNIDVAGPISRVNQSLVLLS